MKNIDNEIIEMYKNGMRASSISAQIRRSYDEDTKKKYNDDFVKEIIMNYKRDTYLSKNVNEVSYSLLLDLYKNKKSIIDIMMVYPELTFGMVKKVIEDYYHLVNVKKPYSISFPKEMIKIALKNKSIEEVSEEYGYSVTKIKKEVNLPFTEEEKFAKKMKILEQDTNILSTKKFNNKYKNIGLDRDVAKKLIKEYKETRKNK